MHNLWRLLSATSRMPFSFFHRFKGFEIVAGDPTLSEAYNQVLKQVFFREQFVSLLHSPQTGGPGVLILWYTTGR